MGALRIFVIGLTLAFARRAINSETAQLQLDANASEATQGDCKVDFVKQVCNCNDRSRKGYQCSECKDKQNWGYGCDLDCPAECGKTGCDFVGNCVEKTLEKGKENPRCKRNSRVQDKTDNVFNLFGNCAACERGWYGYDCDEKCEDRSPNFDETPEGVCTRAGKGYKCKDGWYGEFCNMKCPGGCLVCAMKDNLVPHEGTGAKISYLPAGACTDKCTKDTWGLSCKEPCPSNCKKSHIPSCDKTNGFCYKCGTNTNKKPGVPHQWWGDKCEKECAPGCVDNQCDKKTGTCEKGVKAGGCGANGDQTCPEGTIGKCNLADCMPHKCASGSYPGKIQVKGGDKMAACLNCPEQCDGICEQDGTCKKCQDGFWGSQCDKTCSKGCANNCDQNQGYCDSCKNGLTGNKCEKRCHTSCATCKQYNGFGRSGTAVDMCTSCPPDQPSFFNPSSSTCDCIEGAHVSEELGYCVCDTPTEQFMESYFVARPKTCIKKCEDKYKMVYGDKLYKCLTAKFYKDVVKSELTGSLEQGDCASNEMSIPVQDEAHQCLRQAFVDYILQE